GNSAHVPIGTRAHGRETYMVPPGEYVVAPLYSRFCFVSESRNSIFRFVAECTGMFALERLTSRLFSSPPLLFHVRDNVDLSPRFFLLPTGFQSTLGTLCCSAAISSHLFF
ncbi:unnamed protein product, partial [Sphacelaria rigidula]